MFIWCGLKSNNSCRNWNFRVRKQFQKYNVHESYQRSSDTLNLELPTEMAEIKVAKKKNYFCLEKIPVLATKLSRKVIFTFENIYC